MITWWQKKWQNITHTEYLIIHLLGAIENIYHDTQGPSKIFGGLCLSSSSWTSWGTTHSQMQWLSQCDITPTNINNLHGDGMDMHYTADNLLFL